MCSTCENSSTLNDQVCREQILSALLRETLADDFLTYCKKEGNDDAKLFVEVFDTYEKIIVGNSDLNDKISGYIKWAHLAFMGSIVGLILFILFIINSFK